MNNRPNDENGGVTPDDDNHMSDDPIGARVRERSRDTRRFIVLLVLIGVVLSFFFGSFVRLKSATVNVDLRLAADAYAREGDRVLVDAEVVDPRSGRVRHARDVYLDVFRDGVRQDRWEIKGVLRRQIVMDDGPVELRMMQKADGPVQPSVQVVVKSGDPAFEVNARARRGGANPSPGQAGLRRVRTRDACDWRIDAVAYGGVPVASVRTPTLFRVSDRSGAPASGVALEIEGAGKETHRVRTDENGLAVAGLQMDELSYVEARAECEAGEHYTGFEAQPVHDGLMVTKLVHEPGRLRAVVQDITQRRDARYDLRCDGALRAFSHVPSSGVIEIKEDDIGEVASGTSCVLQIYRAVFATHASYTAYPFQWREKSLAWDWAQQADGVTLVGLSNRTRSADADDAEITAWREAGYQRIRIGIAVVLGLSMLLWFVFVRWELVTHRPVVADADMSRDGFPNAALKMRVNPVLWSGWAAITISLGSLYVVLWLMGL